MLEMTSLSRGSVEFSERVATLGAEKRSLARNAFGFSAALPGFIHRTREEAPNDLKLSDSGPAAGAVTTSAQGEGAGCAWASWRAAQRVTEPVGLQPPPLIGTDMTAVRCSAWLGVAGVG